MYKSVLLIIFRCNANNTMIFSLNLYTGIQNKNYEFIALKLPSSSSL